MDGTARVTDRDPEFDALLSSAQAIQTSKIRASANGHAPHAWIVPSDRALKIGGAVRLATGFATLDENTRGGFRVGKRIIFGGAPGAGKTTWLVQLCWEWARAGHLVAVLCFDEEAEDVLIRVGQINGISREALERGDDEARVELSSILAETPTFHLLDGDEDDYTISGVSVDLAQKRADGQISVLAIDSIQTAREPAPADSALETDKKRVDRVMAALKRAGKVDGHLVLATCELNRGGYRSQNPNERVDDLAAFKESGGVEYGASAALVLREVKDSPGTVDATLPKNRMGRKKPFRLQMNSTDATFREIEKPEPIEEEAAASPMQIAKEKLIRVVSKSIEPIDSASELARRAKVGKGTTLRAVKELIEDGRLVKKGGVFGVVLTGSGTGSEPVQRSTGSAVPTPLRGEPGTGTAAGTAKTKTGNGAVNRTDREPGEDDDA